MKIVWTHIGGRSIVPLQFHWNVYTAWPLFNRMAPCGLCECGSRGGHRQAELELPQSPKWLKIKKKKNLYSEDTVLKCISFLERAIIPSLFHPLWESSQGYGFSCGHVWMRELDCEEGWVPKNWSFWTVVLEKTLESPLDCKEIQPVHSEGDQSWVLIGGTDAEAETPILWPPHAKSWLIGKDPDAGRD